MDKKVYIKTYGLLYLCIVAIVFAVALFLWKIFRFNLLIVTGIILLAAIPLSFVMLKILLANEKNKPLGKLYSEFRKEYFTNGYTEKYFELFDKAVTAYKNGKKIDLVYLKDFVLFTVDYYNATEQYDKALELIMLLDEEQLTKKSMIFIDYGMSAIAYYGCLMETYRGLRDREKAINMMERAKPVLDMDLKHEVLKMASDAVYYNYYMLIENYERAREFADKLMSYSSPEADRFFTRYYIEAEYLLHLGKPNEADGELKKMEAIIEGDLKPLLSFFYTRYRMRLGLDEKNDQ
ncbi:MAG: DUF4229 domain-containing protein [Clostridiales bacterium]|nr:DUF4229 domain-containing protein [Clostridiales bacterium]